jgi:hypothetical protein
MRPEIGKTDESIGHDNGIIGVHLSRTHGSENLTLKRETLCAVTNSAY